MDGFRNGSITPDWPSPGHFRSTTAGKPCFLIGEQRSKHCGALTVLLAPPFVRDRTMPTDDLVPSGRSTPKQRPCANILLRYLPALQ